MLDLDLIYSYCIPCEFLSFINYNRFLVVVSIYFTKSRDLYPTENRSGKHVVQNIVLLVFL